MVDTRSSHRRARKAVAVAAIVASAVAVISSMPPAQAGRAAASVTALCNVLVDGRVVVTGVTSDIRTNSITLVSANVQVSPGSVTLERILERIGGGRTAATFANTIAKDEATNVMGAVAGDTIVAEVFVWGSRDKLLATDTVTCAGTYPAV